MGEEKHMADHMVQITELAYPGEMMELEYVWPVYEVDRITVSQWLVREMARITADPERTAELRFGGPQVALFVNAVPLREEEPYAMAG